MNRDYWITWVEHMDAQGGSPFWMVKQMEAEGFVRLEAIELYRLGTLAWSLV